MQLRLVVCSFSWPNRPTQNTPGQQPPPPPRPPVMDFKVHHTARERTIDGNCGKFCCGLQILRTGFTQLITLTFMSERKPHKSLLVPTSLYVAIIIFPILNKGFSLLFLFPGKSPTHLQLNLQNSPRDDTLFLLLLLFINCLVFVSG